VWAHCVVSILLWDPKAAIRLSGCTGGTIKVGQRRPRDRDWIGGLSQARQEKGRIGV
jgi:hypothetical protein